jgi:hypothetical protein
MEQHTLISLVLPYDYGNLGGGRSRTVSEFSEDDNDAYLESIAVEFEEVVEDVAEPIAELPEPEPPAPADSLDELTDALDVPPAPDFGDEAGA